MSPHAALPATYLLRHATTDDLAALGTLIARSARALGADDYAPAQIEGALRGAFGVDTQLIRDRTYFVVEHGGRLVGCGGWGRRRTLFGGDARPDRDAAELDPHRDAAKIRAFFIDPDFARRGIGAAILERCEQDAIAHGFSQFELMATLAGVRLYAARGYVAGEPIEWPLGDGLTITFVPMNKHAAA
jgi:GNAT superfamily N-acetyltransferase